MKLWHLVTWIFHQISVWSLIRGVLWVLSLLRESITVACIIISIEIAKPTSTCISALKCHLHLWVVKFLASNQQTLCVGSWKAAKVGEEKAKEAIWRVGVGAGWGYAQVTFSQGFFHSWQGKGRTCGNVAKKVFTSFFASLSSPLSGRQLYHGGRCHDWYGFYYTHAHPPFMPRSSS